MKYFQLCPSSNTVDFSHARKFLKKNLEETVEMLIESKNHTGNKIEQAKINYFIQLHITS